MRTAYVRRIFRSIHTEIPDLCDHAAEKFRGTHIVFTKMCTNMQNNVKDSKLVIFVVWLSSCFCLVARIRRILEENQIQCNVLSFHRTL